MGIDLVWALTRALVRGDLEVVEWVGIAYAAWVARESVSGGSLFQ